MALFAAGWVALADLKTLVGSVSQADRQLFQAPLPAELDDYMSHMQSLTTLVRTAGTSLSLITAHSGISTRGI